MTIARTGETPEFILIGDNNLRTLGYINARMLSGGCMDAPNILPAGYHVSRDFGGEGFACDGIISRETV